MEVEVKYEYSRLRFNNCPTAYAEILNGTKHLTIEGIGQTWEEAEKDLIRKIHLATTVPAPKTISLPRNVG